MPGSCCDAGFDACGGAEKLDRNYRRILVIALVINAVMFVVEMIGGWMAGSVSLQADSLDFLGDAANYGISLFVLGMSLRHRARAALAKGVTMGLFGLWVGAAAIWRTFGGGVPHAITMGSVGLAAFVANLIVFALLWKSRGGDSNMRSVWVCSRNDVLGNFAVLLAAAGTLGAGSRWPDIAVALVMATLALQGAWRVIESALAELEWSQSPSRIAHTR